VARTFQDDVSVPSSEGPLRCPETSLTSYQPTPRNVPEERRPIEND